MRLQNLVNKTSSVQWKTLVCSFKTSASFYLLSEVIRDKRKKMLRSFKEKQLFLSTLVHLENLLANIRGQEQ